jgi:serine/threonine-protein kinase
LLPIGRGGSANISIALARGIGGFSKLVVLKSIRDELIAQSDAVKMFMDEARVSARMNHPNIVHVYEVFLRRGVPVIAMEYLDGQALSTIMARSHGTGALSLDLAIAIQARVLAALHYAHTLRDYTGEPVGLIHRDVSPQNVMITYDGQVKLVDFGVAKLTKTGHQTRTGVVKGKLAYMAPEQFIGEVDCRADLFAVGVMLWELASGQRYWGDLPEPALVGRLIARDLPHLRAQPEMGQKALR